jgi:hypothetical protein
MRKLFHLYISYLRFALLGMALFVAVLYPSAKFFFGGLKEANMTFGSFDLEALVRAMSISAGVSLVGGAIGYFVMRKRGDWSRWRPVLTMGAIGIAVLSATVFYYAWPSLIEVPKLDNLSRDQAEELLNSRGLVPEPRLQYAGGVEPGRVIANSQDPVAGLKVKSGYPVHFAVSIKEDQLSTVGTSPDTLTLSLGDPRAGQKAECVRGGDGLYRLSASGASSGLSGGKYGLLLWIRPINPPSDTPGWFLQRPPGNGISKVAADGSWIGTAQIGNAQWPPQEGNTIELAVTIAELDTIKNLMGEQGVVVRPQPVGVKTVTAPNVVLTLR